jgi:hypothetical protein
MKLHSVALAAALALSAGVVAASAPVAMEQSAGSIVRVTHVPRHVVMKHTVRHSRVTRRHEVRRTTTVKRERERNVAVAPDNANDANRRRRMDEALERYRSTHKSSS